MPRIFLLASALASSLAFGQAGDRISEPEAPRSRWQAQQDLLDQQLRSHALVASDPRDLWVAGTLDTLDPWAQVAALAQARVRAPGEMLYIASLAIACLQPLQPLPPECDITDRLADWAIRDADNGLPVLLLADRARRRNNAEAMIAYLDDAATRAHFDDYRDRAALVMYQALRALPSDVDPAAKAELAASYAARNAYAVQRIEGMCGEPQHLAESIRNACYAAGTAVAQRAASWALRAAGARLADRTATGGRQALAQRRLAEVSQRSYDCAQATAQALQSLESSDAAMRAQAVAQWQARLARQAQVGEVAACEAKE